MSEYKVHYLKTWPAPYSAVERGIKTFEYRKNDRNFCVGDVLVLEEWYQDEGYTGRYLYVEVTYVLAAGFGVPDGYCVMSITNLLSSNKWRAVYENAGRKITLEA